MLSQVIIAAKCGETVIALRSRDLVSLNRHMMREYESHANEVNLFEWDYLSGLRHATEGSDADCTRVLPTEDYTKEAGFFRLLDKLLAMAPKGREIGVRKNKPDDTLIILVHGAHYLFSSQGMTLRTATVLSRVFNDLKGTPIRLCLLVDHLWTPVSEIAAFVPILTDALPRSTQISNAVYGMKKKDRDGTIVRSVSRDDAQKIADTLVGLTMTEAESLASRVVKRFDTSNPQPFLNELRMAKLDRINQEGLVKVLDPQDCPRENELVGMQGLRDYVELYSDILQQDRVKAKGLMLLGPTGTGKSHFSRSLGRRLNLPVVEPKFAQILSSFQSISEKNWEKVEGIIDSQGVCIVYMDEVNRIVPTGGQNNNDSSRRLLGMMLNYFANRKENAILIGSANSLRDLDPAFTRAGRCDAVFMVDLPTPMQLKAIWCYYLDHFELLLDDDLRGDFFVKIGIHERNQVYADWTGAEVKQACEQAYVRKIAYFCNPEVRKKDDGQPFNHLNKVIPVFKRYRQELTELREWANEKVLCAETGNAYEHPTRNVRATLPVIGPPPTKRQKPLNN